MHHINRIKEECKLIYLGNESCEQELQTFLETSPLKELNQVYNFTFNDDFALRIRTELNLDSMPTVIVFDKNLEIISTDGAADLLHLETPEMVRGVWIR